VRLGELEGQVRDLSEMLAWNLRGDAVRGAPATRDSQPQAAENRARVTPDEATEYRRALDLYFARRYAEAVRAFKDLLASRPDGAYAGNAEYWIGESLYAQGDYTGASAAFRRVFTHPGNAKIDDAQLKLGYCALRLGDRRRAGEEFRKLVSLHPTSEYVERARGELEKLDNE
jgi:tol-pal system protein YbgF